MPVQFTPLEWPISSGCSAAIGDWTFRNRAAKRAEIVQPLGWILAARWAVNVVKNGQSPGVALCDVASSRVGEHIDRPLGAVGTRRRLPHLWPGPSARESRLWSRFALGHERAVGELPYQALAEGGRFLDEFLVLQFAE